MHLSQKIRRIIVQCCDVQAGDEQLFSVTWPGGPLTRSVRKGTSFVLVLLKELQIFELRRRQDQKGWLIGSASCRQEGQQSTDRWLRSCWQHLLHAAVKTRTFASLWGMTRRLWSSLHQYRDGVHCDCGRLLALAVWLASKLAEEDNTHGKMNMRCFLYLGRARCASWSSTAQKTLRPSREFVSCIL